jgi:hypothetical protein
MIATTICRRCGQLVGVSYSMCLNVHFATVKDARPCPGSYENAFVNHPMSKKKDDAKKGCN